MVADDPQSQNDLASRDRADTLNFDPADPAGFAFSLVNLHHNLFVREIDT